MTPWQPDPPPDPGPRRLDESLDRLARGIGGPSATALGGVFTRWAEVVGDDVAAHAAPVSLASGTLVVSVDHPTWATELRYLQAVVLGRLDEAVGEGVVRSLEVRVRPR